MNRKAFGGFTLVELLIVITIISILASMLLPALKSARNHAKAIACKSRQKQLMLITMDYANDCKGINPCVASPPGYPNGRWGGIFYENGYLPESLDSAGKITQCPLDPPKDPTSWHLWDYWAYNGFGMIRPRNFGGIRDEYFLPHLNPYYFSLWKAKNPSQTSLYSDSFQGTTNCTYYLYKHPSFGELRYYYMRHSKTANIAFFDGHVKGVNRSALYALPNYDNPDIKY